MDHQGSESSPGLSRHSTSSSGIEADARQHSISTEMASMDEDGQRQGEKCSSSAVSRSNSHTSGFDVGSKAPTEEEAWLHRGERTVTHLRWNCCSLSWGERNVVQHVISCVACWSRLHSCCLSQEFRHHILSTLLSKRIRSALGDWRKPWWTIQMRCSSWLIYWTGCRLMVWISPQKATLQVGTRLKMVFLQKSLHSVEVWQLHVSTVRIRFKLDNL